MAPEGTTNPQRWVELATPDERPSWDCNAEEGKVHLERYRVTILQGLKKGARKAMSMGKSSKVILRESESPSEFYERLCEGCRLYTPIDPEAARSQMVINAACVSSLPQKCQIGGHQVTHEFLYIPKCPVPLLGRDLLSKLGAQVTFPPSPCERPTLRMGSTTCLLFLSVTPQDEWRLHDLPEGKLDGLNS